MFRASEIRGDASRSTSRRSGLAVAGLSRRNLTWSHWSSEHVAHAGGGDADVTARGEREQVVARFGGQREAADELVQDVFGERAAARELFELLVGFGQAVLAHHDLYRFAQHLPDLGEVALGGGGVEGQAAQAAARGLDGDQR